MNYKKVDVVWDRTSKSLDGALCSDNIFGFLRFNDYSREIEPDYYDISLYVPSNISKDSENDIFISDNGVVADAFDFSELTEQERTLAMKQILAEKQGQYPGYEFSIVPGKFPLGLGDASGYDSPPVIMSSHILCITNYKELLHKNKSK